MIIYIDLILILNFIIDMLLLISVDMLLKRKVPFKRIALASFIGSLSTLSLFYISSSVTLLLIKLLISIVMVIIAFKYESFNYFKENLFWLYIISIILGGGLYLLNDQITLTNNGIAFSSNGFRLNMLVLVIITPIIIFNYVKIQRRLSVDYSNLYDVSIYLKGEVFSGTGFLDTGNKLVDPYFQRPIILVNKELINWPVKKFLVPYKLAGGSGLLEVFKPEKIVVNNKKLKNTLVGLSDVNMDGIKIILNTKGLL